MDPACPPSSGSGSSSRRSSRLDGPQSGVAAQGERDPQLDSNAEVERVERRFLMVLQNSGNGSKQESPVLSL